MREALRSNEFAALAGIDPADVERYVEAGLLDLDGDGLFDQFDVLRLRVILIGVDGGQSVAEIAKSIPESPAFIRSLFQIGASPIADLPAKVGLSQEQIDSFRLALGLPGLGFDEEGLELMTSVKAMIDAGFPYEAMLDGAKVLGDTMRRFAETEIQLTHTNIHEPMAAQGVSDREIARRSQEILDAAVMPVMEPMIAFVHRQHLIRAAIEDALYHLESPGESTGGTLQRTILFVDLTSFTSLANVHGDQEAAATLDRFDHLVRGAALDHHGNLVKQIGDAFMLSFIAAEDGLSFALAISASASGQDRFPAMRIGVHAGPVLYRVGDYVGNTVNIASRIATAAMPGEILTTSQVADAARGRGIAVVEAGVRLVRGIDEPISLFRVTRPAAVISLRDPVCGMSVSGDPVATLTREGIEYGFCSEECLRRFLTDPAKYSGASAAG